MKSRWIVLAIASLSLLAFSSQANAQLIGIEFHNQVMPASGGMAGASFANPQDLPSAINGNPATLADFRGTQFTFGGGWIDGNITLDHQQNTPPLPGVDSFTAPSIAQGILPGSIGVSQDLNFMGLPGTFGLGFISGGGGGAFFQQEPNSNGLSAMMTVFEIPMTAGVQLTDKLKVGASMHLGTAIFSGPFVGITSASYDYALRGSFGLKYDLGCDTSFGATYMTKQNFKFDDAVRIELPSLDYTGTQDVSMSLPRSVILGLSNESLMCGNLLLAVDVIYKNWDDAPLFASVYRDQWAILAGAQLTKGKVKLRAGYGWVRNPLDPNPQGASIGNVPIEGNASAIYYAQSTLATISEHRISGGIGMQDVIPGVDVDLSAGGSFKTTGDLGPNDQLTISMYWIGAGITWRFSRGSESPASQY